MPGYAALIAARPSRPARDVEGTSSGPVRHRHAAAEVDGVHGADVAGERREFGVDIAPVADRLDAAAQVRVQAGDAQVEFARPAATKASMRASGKPNLASLPPVRTFWWWPSPRPRSSRSHALRPRSSSGQRCSASMLSRVTLTPRAYAASYSLRGAKLGVNSTRAGSIAGNTAKTRSSSPCDTHSKPQPSASSARRIAGCALALSA